ncbi:MAG: hypothetical protein U1E65_14855 [Myxococcota bacterium]
MSRLVRIIALSLLGLVGCAGATSNVSARDYRRPEADQVKLGVVDVVVVVSGPPRIAGDRLDVQGFPPIEGDTVLAGGPRETETEAALVKAVRAELSLLGLEAHFLGRPAEPRLASTSSTSSTSSVAVPAAPPAPLPETLEAALASSKADALLVVRAIPVDAFALDVGAGTHIEETALGRQQVRDFRPEKHEGRLMVGQAFLFDRQSKVRLWSRQAPDFPEEGRLTPDHPFLRFGYVASSTLTAPPSEALRAARAGERFGHAILEGLPHASAGTPEARAALDTLDPAAEAKRDAFFDQGHFAFDFAFAYGAETNQLELNLEGKALPTLSAGALTPSGLLRGVPRVSYIASSGLTLSASFAFGTAPSSFGRTYFRDNASPTLADPLDRAIQAKLSGSSLYGPELTVGGLMHISDSLFLLPRGGVFFEVWNVQATPAVAFPNLNRVRIGATAGGEAWLRMSENLYVRGALDLRLGADLNGPFLFGFRLLAGLGILL